MPGEGDRPRRSVLPGDLRPSSFLLPFFALFSLSADIMSTLARMRGKVIDVAIALDAAPMKNASRGPRLMFAASFAVSFLPFPPLKPRLYSSFSLSNAAKLMAGLTTSKQLGPSPAQNAGKPPLAYTSLAVDIRPWIVDSFLWLPLPPFLSPRFARSRPEIW